MTNIETKTKIKHLLNAQRKLRQAYELFDLIELEDKGVSNEEERYLKMRLMERVRDILHDSIVYSESLEEKL